MTEAAVRDELRSWRPTADAWCGGVCAGLAAQLHWSPIVLRVLFVAAASFRLAGVPVYLALWLAMPRQPAPRQAPGLETASRAGMRTDEPVVSRWLDAGVALALLALGGGLTWLVQGVGWGLSRDQLLAGAVASVGTALVWRQADRGTPADGRVSRRWLRALVRHWRTALLVLAGMALLAVAVAILVVTAPVGAGARGLLAVGLGVAAVVIVVLPWIVRARRQLARARADQRVADARADMAAHLHDSVLQTLALIQRRADDPRAVAALARRQERELRAYLYGEPDGEATLVAALAAEASDVEAIHGVDIDVVTVGDAPMDAAGEALTRAAREAMVNAARHAGVGRVDVYAEVDGDRASVYVRDRGAGFDLDKVDADRVGVRHSIVERMERAGGRAIVRTAPGEGTEVRMEVPR